MRCTLFLVVAVVIFAVNFLSFAGAKEEATIQSFGDMWRGALAKMKENPSKFKGWTSAATNENAIVKYKETSKLLIPSAKNSKNALRGAGPLASDSTKNLERAIVKIESGVKLKPLNTASGKWKGDFAKLKAAGQFKNADEKQVAKVTEGIAQEIVKNPSKSQKMMKAGEISFGVGMTVLVAATLSFE